MKVSAEDVVMNLIVNGGDARSKAIEALRSAKTGDFESARKLMEESHKSIQAAHQFQTTLLHGEMDEDTPDPVEVDLLMVHGQDHLMNALTVQDIVTEMIDILKMKKC
ncbi:MAG: PTS lactose/cellobiose transporter subunit IIA [Treponema sp.]|nr:PTS lactose/cellobiose transporter subunit IIA [Treponema sp.]